MTYPTQPVENTDTYGVHVDRTNEHFADASQHSTAANVAAFGATSGATAAQTRQAFQDAIAYALANDLRHIFIPARVRPHPLGPVRVCCSPSCPRAGFLFALKPVRIHQIPPRGGFRIGPGLCGYSANFAITEFYEVRQGFIGDSSPLASVAESADLRRS
jgi:hypothetical protein